MLHDLVGFSFVLILFFLPSVLLLSFVAVVVGNVATARYKRGPMPPRTRLILYWMVLVLIRLFCLWQITVTPEGAGYFFLGAPVLPEIGIEFPKAATLEVCVRAFVVLADTIPWALLLAKMPQRQRKATVP